MLTTALLFALSVAAPASDLPEPARVEAWLAPLVEDGWVMGLVVGLADGDDVQVTGLGRISAADGRAPDGDTLFEIGSVTKVITGTLLAEAVSRGELGLDDAVADRLPPEAGARADEAGGWRPITLTDLATHHAGLPRLPDNFSPVDPADPYADYTTARLYDWLDGYELTVPDESSHLYSNLGAGLLGYVLSQSGDGRYETLLRERFTGPLGLEDTVLTLDRDQLARFAPGYDADLRPAAHWHFDALAGCGAVRSTVHDLLDFGRAQIGRSETELAPALALAMVPRRLGPRADVQVGLGWQVDVGRGVWFHNGQTGGYHTFFAVVPDTGQVIVVLANTASLLVSDVGEGLLQLMAGAEPPDLGLPRLARLDSEALEARVGRFAFTSLPSMGLRITKDEQGLLAQINEPRPLRIYPRDATHFDYRLVNARIEFVQGEDGAVDELVLHQFGRTLEARRIP